MVSKVFISHKNEGDSNYIGGELEKLLDEAGYQVFIDENIQKGDEWQKVIVTNLVESDVVVILLEEATGGSHWVQREIDMANALGISLMPLIYGNTQADEIKAALKKFDLGSIQYVHYTLSNQQQALQDVVDSIERLSKKTLDKQTQQYDRWKMRRSAQVIKKTRGKCVPDQVILSHPDTDIQFQLACGDASTMKGYDILVNTENNYMQMARFYETNTLSCAIRKNGANFRGGRLKHDTIQEELFQFAAAHGGLPAAEGSVFITSAGHEDSDMRDPDITDYRYIFHVSAVRIDVGNRTIDPYSNIAGFMEESILAIRDLEKADGGVEKSDGGYIIEPSDDFKPIESILFPVFGAGNGGKTFADAIEDIVACFSREVIEEINKRKVTLKKVGLAIFFEEDVEDVKQVFLSNGFDVVKEN